MLYNFYACRNSFSWKLLKWTLSFLVQESEVAFEMDNKIIPFLSEKGWISDEEQLTIYENYHPLEETLDLFEYAGFDLTQERIFYNFRGSLIELFYQLEQRAGFGYLHTHKLDGAVWSEDSVIDMFRTAFVLRLVDFSLFDEIQLTEIGKEWVLSNDDRVIIKQIMALPTTHRMLEIIKNKECHAFELGLSFGFEGSAGFESIPEEIFSDIRSDISDNQEKIIQHIEGGADGFCRFFADQLTNLNILTKRIYNGISFYKITETGINYQKNYITEKFIQKRETTFLPTILYDSQKSRSPFFIKRYKVLKFISENRETTYEMLANEMKKLDPEWEDRETICYLEELRRVGYSIEYDNNFIRNNDYLSLWDIPLENITVDHRLIIKEGLIKEIKSIPKKYLAIYDHFEGITYPSETKKSNLFLNELIYFLFTEELYYDNPYPINLASSYLCFNEGENSLLIYWLPSALEHTPVLRKRAGLEYAIEKNKKLNLEKELFFLIVVNSEDEEYKSIVPQIAKETNTKGLLLHADQLLRLAEGLKAERLTYSRFYSLFQNNEIHFPNMKNFYS